MFKKFFKPKFLLIFFIVASLSLPALIGLAYYGSSYSTGYQIMSQEKGAIITINSSGVRKMINSNS